MAQFNILKEFDNMSLRNFLKEKFEGYTTREIESFLNRNGCKVNQSIERFGSKKLRQGDKVFVYEKLLAKKDTQEQKIDILFQDDDLIIINKPDGLSSSKKDLEKALKVEVFVVHRLDKLTSGVLIIAKNASMQKSMEKLFFNKEVEKEYFAVTQGKVKGSSGKIDEPLKLKKRYEGGVIYETTRFGKEAITLWQKKESSAKASYLLLQPQTGRTHQIRVHLSSIGHPIIGDPIYGSEGDLHHTKMMLHAYKVHFIHPRNGKHLVIIAPSPKAMSTMVKSYFKSKK